MRWNTSFKNKILASFIILFSLLIIVFSVLYYRQASNTVMNVINDKLIQTAISSHYLIDGDLHQTIDSLDSPYYQKMTKFLATYREQLGVADIYTLIRSGNTTKMVLASYDPDMSFMKDYMLTDYMKDAFNGEFTVTAKPYHDSFGDWYTSYGPIYNKAGKVVAIVAVDIREDYVRDLKREILIDTVIVAFIAFLITSLGANIAARLLQDNINRFRQRIYEVEQGNFNYKAPEHFDIEEFKELALHFEGMNKKIRDLVQRMRNTADAVSERSNNIIALLEKAGVSTEMLSSLVEQQEEVMNVTQNELAERIGSLEMICVDVGRLEQVLASEGLDKDALHRYVSELSDRCEDLLGNWEEQIKRLEGREAGDRQLLSLLENQVRQFKEIYENLKEIESMTNSMGKGLDGFIV